MTAKTEPRRTQRRPNPRTPLRARRDFGGWTTALAGGVIVAGLFARTLGYPFLNWDDQEVFVRNTALQAPGFVRWAFTTTYIDHYQPAAWLTWGTLDRLWALTPAAAHALNVGLHAACAVLVFALTYRWCERIDIAAIATLLFAAHPLRVEVVAWASAMPYALALLFALLSTLVFLDARDRTSVLALSISLYAMSLLARPIALGLPIVFYCLAALKGPPYKGCAIAREAGTGGADDRSAVADDAGTRGAALSGPPTAIAVLASVALAILAAFVESRARTAATMGDVTVGARLTLALTAPFRYLWKTIAPVRLTPLDPLAIAPRTDATLILVAGAALIAISWLAWIWRRRFPAVVVAWFSYLALLAPAAGLLPSGLQATADRYSYLPSVPVSIGIAMAAAAIAARSPRMIGRALLPIASAIVIAALAWMSYQQTGYWRDSITLWTRAVEIDPASDVALYNLASALADEGRRDEALARYEDVLKIVPNQTDARRNRDALLAARIEDEANRLAASGHLDAAIDAYRRTIALDPARTHAQASLGIALVERGRISEALPPLREAVERGSSEAAVPNALAFVLVKEGRTREACEVLQNARARFPDDVNIARNLEGLHCSPR